jgi:hypothetical protein
LKSFLFTLKNPHNLPARRFALKAERQNKALYCMSSRGPCFWDIGVSNDCNSNTSNGSCLGGSYVNDTGLHGKKVLTGSKYFTMKEIEIFEIIN